jgi:septum formation protein
VRLLLASGSAARRAMLAAAGVAFETVLAEFDEEGTKAELRAKGAGAADLALALAGEKARHVRAAGDVLVLGADQTLELEDGSMLDKPAGREDALAQLRRMSGSKLRLHSAAVAVEAGEDAWTGVETVTMTVRALSDRFIEQYLDAEYELVQSNVGVFRIEGRGVQLFERIEGSHFAILGLPLLPLLGYLRGREVMPS